VSLAAICALCQRPIHALDEQTGVGNKQRHTDCTLAARIDYPAAFDRLYDLAGDAAQAIHRVVTESAADPGYTDKYGRLIVDAWEILIDASAMRTYAAERGV